MAVLVLGAVLAALVLLIGWISYLIFCYAVLKRTGSAKSLKHAAKAASAFRGSALAGLGAALAKLFTLRGR